MTLSRSAVVLALIGLACGEVRDPGGLEPLAVEVRGDTVALSAPLGLLAAARTLRADQTISGQSFPTDLVAFEDGGLGILDRLDRQLHLYDGGGDRLASIGREGEGPGEYREPYAIASSGAYLAVWDKTGRLTMLRPDFSVSGTSQEVRGDLPAVWQRLPTSPWEEPLQLSREDVTRRLGGLGEGRFGVLVQERDERFDTAFLGAGELRRYTHHVLVVDSLARVSDTLVSLTGQELQVAHRPTEMTYAVARERAFPLRPQWAAGDGWYASAEGGSAEIQVVFETGRTMRIEWPMDVRPLEDEELRSVIEWEIEGYRRTKGSRVADQVASAPQDGWMRQLAEVRERPQIVGLLGAGECIAMSGLRTQDTPHGESGTWVVVPLGDPRRGQALRLGAGPFLARAFTAEAFSIIAIDEHGEREVRILPHGVDC